MSWSTCSMYDGYPMTNLINIAHRPSAIDGSRPKKNVPIALQSQGSAGAAIERPFFGYAAWHGDGYPGDVLRTRQVPHCDLVQCDR